MWRVVVVIVLCCVTHTARANRWTLGMAGGLGYLHGDFSPTMGPAGSLTINGGYTYTRWNLTLEAVTGLDAWSTASYHGPLDPKQTLWAVPLRAGFRYEPRLWKVWVPMVGAHGGVSMVRNTLALKGLETQKDTLPSLTFDAFGGLGYLFKPQWMIAFSVIYASHFPFRTEPIGALQGVIELRYAYDL